MIRGISVKGKCFEQETKLLFFPEPHDRAAIVYGRNGAGKSTISRAFRSLGESSGEGAAPVVASDAALTGTYSYDAEPLEAQLVFEEGQYGLPEVPSTQIVQVFNETFVDERVKVRADGIDTVVLFGEQAELQEQIDDARREIASVQGALDEAIEARDVAVKNENTARQKVEQALKGDWANRSRAILQSSNATSSWSDTFKSIMEGRPARGQVDELKPLLDERIARYLGVTSGARVESSWRMASEETLLDGMSESLLAQVLDVPDGEGIAGLVAESLGRFEEFVNGSEQVFADETVNHCPMCQQALSADYRAALLAAIRDAVDDSAEQLKLKLESAKLTEFSFDSLTVDRRLGEALIAATATAAGDYNVQVKGWNQACELKKSQLYSVLSWDERSLVEAAGALSMRLRELEQARSGLNAELDSRESEKQALIIQNNELTSLELTPQFAALRDASAATAVERKTVEHTGQSLTSLQSVLANLTAQAANVQIAADEINAHLQAIFAESERLKLELHVDGSEDGPTLYHVLNRGRKMRPEGLSVGERNVLALTYFFTTVRRSIEKAPEHASVLVVLDDPVSSVDVDNRLGIHGFVEAQMRGLLSTNNRVRVLLLTHDLTVARDLAKSAHRALPPKGQGNGPNKTQGKKANWSLAGYVLRREGGIAGKTGLERRNFDSLNEYESLLKLAYGYAATDVEGGNGAVNDLQNLTIGNVVRRVLEAFSTFIYKAGFQESALGDAYKGITERDLSLDLRAGHRAFLHDSSHAADGLSSLRFFGGFAGLEPVEQVLHTRRVLALMYTLQEAHMKRYLPKAEEDFKKWQLELLSL